MSDWKDTEIGLIPRDWKIEKIDNIKSEQKAAIAMGPFGSNITKDNFVDHGIPVIRGNNLTDFIFRDDEFVFLTEEKSKKLSSSSCKKGDIVITHRGTLGQVGYIPNKSKYDKYIISQSGMKISVNESVVNSKFLFLFLKSRLGQHLLLRNTSQTGVPAISQPTTSLKLIPVPLPPLKEQTAIVKVIWTIQEKIENLMRQNETLEAIAQTLFKHWFIDFEFPNADGKPYKSSGGAMITSELGDIPRGWKVGTLSNEFEIIMGQSPAGSSFNEDKQGIVFFQGRTDFGFRFPSVRLYTTEPSRIAEKFDILVSVRAPVGDINVASEKCCIGRGLAAIKSKDKSYCLHKLKSYKKLFNLFESEGTVFGSINKQSFNDLASIIPNNEVIKNFEILVQTMDKKFYVNNLQIQTLTKTRDTLLPKLMSGQLRVDM